MQLNVTGFLINTKTEEIQHKFCYISSFYLIIDTVRLYM